jgi:aspartyl protease family protein
MKNLLFRSFAISAALISASFGTAAAPCESERYFSPTDFTQDRPLRGPHAEFSAFVKKARSGDAAAQRSLGASYDAGYLVDKCEGKAVYWYRKAAVAGDEVAKLWVARFELFERIRQGPQCAGSACPFAREDSGPQFIVLYANANGSFRVPVMIGNVTVEGIVDTGADTVAMSARQAREMGIAYSSETRVLMQTANGNKEAILTTLDSVRVGGIVLRNVRATVSEGEMPLLLGMSFLGRVNVSINQGRMTLAKPNTF